MEQVIAAHLDSLFPAMRIAEHHVFRVTRNADLSVDEDEAEDLLAAVELELHRRRFGQAVRLEVAAGISTDLLDMLVAEVDVPEDNVYLCRRPPRPRRAARPRPSSTVPTWPPSRGPRSTSLAPSPAAATSSPCWPSATSWSTTPTSPSRPRSRPSWPRAADDPDVLAIKQTLYRTGADSPVVASLIRASQAGKQVTAVVELQARFDEQANIAWARALEEAGVQVIYGLARLKTHAKISLVVRREGDEIRRYCHIGTGNYNSGTARAYEDLGLLHRRSGRSAPTWASCSTCSRVRGSRRPSGAWWSRRCPPARG